MTGRVCKYVSWTSEAGVIVSNTLIILGIFQHGRLSSQATKQPCIGFIYGLSRFFSSGHGKTIPSLAVCHSERSRGYPMIMEQIVRGDTCSPGPPETSHPRVLYKHVPQRKRGRPKGSRNRNKPHYLETDSNAGRC